MKEKRTIYTIAQDLGLAPSTISKIINHKGNINEQTRERVLAYIKEVGFVPVSSARTLKAKKSFTVGVVFTEEANVGLEHSFFSSILQHFKDYLEKEGYELSFIVKKLGQHEMSYLEWCRNKQVDGIYIVVGNYDDPGLKELVYSEIPCVSTDMIIPGLKSVICNNDQGISLTLKYIKEELKKTKVQLISGPLSSKAFLERYEAFKKYVVEYDLKANFENVEFAESFGFTSGYQACMKLLKKEMPEVIIVASDDLALGVLKALKDQNIYVPNDVQVIGYDDIQYAKHFSPALTTISQNRKVLGETAAKRLIALMNGGDTSEEEVLRLPVQLVKRESTK